MSADALTTNTSVGQEAIEGTFRVSHLVTGALLAKSAGHLVKSQPLDLEPQTLDPP